MRHLDARGRFDLLVGLASIVGVIVAVVLLFSSHDWALVIAAGTLAVVALLALYTAFQNAREAEAARARASEAERVKNESLQRFTTWVASLDGVTQAVRELAALALPGHSSIAGRDFLEQAAQACSALQAAFAQSTGRSCRVTLKEIFADGPERRLAVKTIVSTVSEGHTDRDEAATDWVEENTDFAEIIKGKKFVYFSNDLLVDVSKGYRNSHWPRDLLERAHSADDLPYASTIVWPVRSLVRSSGPYPQWSTLGFLCVDSRSTDAFDESLDVRSGEMVAAALYAGWPTAEGENDGTEAQA